MEDTRPEACVGLLDMVCLLARQLPRMNYCVCISQTNKQQQTLCTPHYTVEYQLPHQQHYHKEKATEPTAAAVDTKTSSHVGSVQSMVEFVYKIHYQTCDTYIVCIV